MSKKHWLILIFITSLLATLGSLYYGRYGDPLANLQTGERFITFNGFAPCQLCRYARILVYPITLLSGIALWRRDYYITIYILPLSLLTLGLETYHYLLQKTNIPTSYYCTMANPCDALSVNYLWFITIPLLCRIVALIITICCLIIIHQNKK